MNETLKWIMQYNKAIAGFVVAGVIKYLEASPGGVTADEWQAVIFAALVGGGLVWLVPNQAKKDTKTQ